MSSPGGEGESHPPHPHPSCRGWSAAERREDVVTRSDSDLELKFKKIPAIGYFKWWAHSRKRVVVCQLNSTGGSDLIVFSLDHQVSQEVCVGGFKFNERTDVIFLFWKWNMISRCTDISLLSHISENTIQLDEAVARLYWVCSCFNEFFVLYSWHYRCSTNCRPTCANLDISFLEPSNQIRK